MSRRWVSAAVVGAAVWLGVAATRVPAEMQGLAAELGTVEVGKRADLLIVGDDLLRKLRALRTIRWVVKDGVGRTPQEWMEAAPFSGAARHPR